LKLRRQRSVSRTAVAVGVIVVVLIAAFYVDYFHRTAAPPPINVYSIAVSFQAGANSYAIPSPFFGVGGLGNPGLGSNPQVISALTEAGFGWTRLEASLNLIFPQGANNPQFSNLNYVLQKAMNAGIRNIILLIDYTPSWLANQSDYPCRSVSHYPPSNFTEWGELAAEVARYVQSNFHFSSIYYEIWNEPDASIFLCTPPSIREATYFSIFHYAAKAILSEAYASNIAVGGPVLANPIRDIQMIYDFVHNPQTAPYIGFVSYHQYTISGLPDSWDNENSVYHQMQNSSSGYAAMYEQIAKIVHSDAQPDAPSTPIFISEFNTNTVGGDCCGNSPIYTPLFNALFVVDLLDSVYSQSGDHSIARGFTYFTLSSPVTGACMFGSWDTAMDCSVLESPPPQPYPSFYPYLLIGGKNYLDLQDANYLATSVNSSLLNVWVLAFSTASGKSILLVNAGSITYSQVGIILKQSVPSSASRANVYNLVASTTNDSFQLDNIPVRSQGNVIYVENLTLPAYTVVGISIPSG